MKKELSSCDFHFHKQQLTHKPNPLHKNSSVNGYLQSKYRKLGETVNTLCQQTQNVVDSVCSFAWPVVCLNRVNRRLL